VETLDAAFTNFEALADPQNVKRKNLPRDTLALYQE
jgi:hypothetical protein